MKRILLVLVLAPIVLAQGPPRRTAGPTQATKDTIRKTLNLKGTFVPSQAAELKIELKVFVDERRGEIMKLVEIRPHGSLVNEGDIIARLDTKDIDRRIESDQMGVDAANMAWRHAQERARLAEVSNKARLARAELDYKRSQAKLEGYLKHEKEHDEESERMSVQGRKNRLDDQHDELLQLEKMYSEDELVDATEEIVLKRSRRNFARSKASFELSERRRLYRKKFFEPWKEEDLRRDLESKKRSLESTRLNIAMGAEKSKLDLAKQEHGLKRTLEKFEDLKKDREQFVVRAPKSGLLLHGKPDGPWGELKKGSTVRNRSVFMTVAAPGMLKVKTSVAEKDIFSVKNGMAVEVTAAARPDGKIVGRLRAETLPAAGKFKAEVEIDGEQRGLVPGMSCTAQAILAEARNAVVIPKGAITTADGRTTVQVAKTADGPYETREVKTGLDDGSRVVILEGVEAGEFVKK
jgi:multidrug efflux pump subunit AcrA (membrane-fusion protein)